jgi:transcriptional regulator with XRE-family HTH domain
VSNAVMGAGDRLLVWRRRHRLTQEQAAGLVGVPRVAWQSWESGWVQLKEPVARLIEWITADEIAGAN